MSNSADDNLSKKLRKRHVFYLSFVWFRCLKSRRVDGDVLKDIDLQFCLISVYFTDFKVKQDWLVFEW